MDKVKNNLAPIIVFVYNRPLHTLRTLEALSRNELADQSQLFIYCDGPKDEASINDLKKIEEVRLIANEKKWCYKVDVIERHDNLGLSKSVIKGVSEVLREYEKVIVLEDDIVTGKYFLRFLNQGLVLYENDKKVYGVSGYKFPNNKKIKKETFFLPIMSSWGYGTWVDRWSKINFNGQELLNIVEKKSIKYKLNFSNLDYYIMLKNQVAGLNDSWAVRFYVSMFLDNGVFLYPRVSLIKNIGFDGTGVHCLAESEKFYDENYKNDTLINPTHHNVTLKKSVLRSYRKRKKMNFYKILKKKIIKKIPPEFIIFFNRKFKKTSKNKILNSLPRYTETVDVLLGTEIQLPDNASYNFMKKEIFNEEIYKFNSKSSKPYIIDGGANIGLATIYFKQIYPNAEILAFEPDKKIFQFLENNIKAFMLNNVTLVNKGLWNEVNNFIFLNEGADSGQILLDDVKQYSDSEIENIDVVSLRPYLVKKVDFLKLDIEGAETLVLKDIEDLLINVNHIFVEYHSFLNKEQTIDEVISILKRANFRLYISSPGVSSKSPLVSVVTYNNMDMQLNIYGTK